MYLAGLLAHHQFIFDSKPEHLVEAMFCIHTHLNAMSSEDPDCCSVMEELADLEKICFKQFGVRIGQQKDNAEVVNNSYLAASSQMVKSNLVEFPLLMPDRRNLGLHLYALLSILSITATDIVNIKKAIKYCRFCLTSPHSHLAFTILVLGHLLYHLFHLRIN